MTRKKRNRKTAAQLMAELESDPEWVASRDRKAELRARRAAEFREAEAPLMEALRSSGFELESVWDLVNTSQPYPRALPILLDHLDRPYPDRIREGIARALAVPDAGFAWSTLRRLYAAEPPGTDAKDGLAVALAETATDDRVQEIVELLADAEHGESRLLLLQALERLGSSTAEHALLELEADPALGREALAVRQRRSSE